MEAEVKSESRLDEIIKQAAIAPALFRACLEAQASFNTPLGSIERLKAQILLSTTIDTIRAKGIRIDGVES